MAELRDAIGLVIFDWAGTAVDFGCISPVAAFVDALAAVGVECSADQARVPMGLYKRDHIQALLEMPDLAAQFEQGHGRPPQDSDVEAIFREQFIPRQLEVVEQHSEPVAGLLETVAFLRDQGIAIGSSTGYFREAANRCFAAAGQAGYKPDAAICADDVPQGRPAPWMIYENMRRLNVYPPRMVVKIGDTVPDIEEGLNAGVWSLGVTDSSSLIGMTAAEWDGLTEEQKYDCSAAAGLILRKAGAHALLNSVAALPEFLPKLAARILAGERP